MKEGKGEEAAHRHGRRGTAVGIQVHPENIRDRDGAVDQLGRPHRKHGSGSQLCAEDRQSDDGLRSELGCERIPIEVEVVEPTGEGFEVFIRRWVVERAFA